MQEKIISYEDALEYAVDAAITAVSHYWSGEASKKIINDNTFGYIWNTFPLYRERLVSIALNAAHGVSYRDYALSPSFAKDWISKEYEILSNKEKLTAIELDAYLNMQPIADISYSYLDGLMSANIECDEEKCEIIKRHGLEKSRDPEFYDFLFESVPRKVGGTDVKYNILEKAYNNNSLSEKLIKKIAKSSPISLKRKIAQLLSGDILIKKGEIYRNRHATLEEKEARQKNIDHSESLLMLFADVADYYVISSIIEIISKDNIPWIMPSVSKINRSYLTKRVERLIESA